MRGKLLITMFFVIILPIAIAQNEQSHPLSEIKPIDTNLDMFKFNITNVTFVGINLTNPQYALDIVGDVRWSGILRGGTVPWNLLIGYDLNVNWNGRLGWGNLTGYNLNVPWTGLLGWRNLTGYDLNVAWVGKLGWGNLTNYPSIITQIGSGLNASTQSLSGNVILGVNFTEVQRRVTGSCSGSKAIQVISADGSVSCVDINLYGNVTGTGISGYIPLWQTSSSLNNSLINQTNGNIWITSGNLNILLGGLQIGGTTVIDSNRSLVGINQVNQNLNFGSSYSIYNANWVNATNLYASQGIYSTNGYYVGNTQVIDSSRNVIAGTWVNGTNAYFAGTIYGATTDNTDILRFDDTLGIVKRAGYEFGVYTRYNFDIWKVNSGDNPVTAGYRIFEVNPSSAFINVTGNVGIGTTSPGYKLDVAGDIRATGAVRTDAVYSNTGYLSASGSNLLTMTPYVDNALGFRTPFKVEKWDGSNWVDITSAAVWGYLTDGKPSTSIALINYNYTPDATRIRFSYDFGGNWVTPAQQLVLYMQHTPTINSVLVEQADDSTFTTSLETLANVGSSGCGDCTRIIPTLTFWRRYLRITIEVSRPSGTSWGLSAREIAYYSPAFWGGSRLISSMVPIDWDYNKNVFFSGSVGIGTTSPVKKLDVVGDVNATGAVYSVNGYYIGTNQIITSARVLQNIASISQSLLPTTDNSYDLGSSSYRWRNAYFSGTIYGNIQGTITPTGNINMQGYSIYNAYDVNATRFFQNGVQVIDTINANAPISVSGSGNSRTIGLNYDTGSFTLSGSNLALSNTGVVAGTYGSASQVVQFTVNAQGRITSASNVVIAIDASQIVSGIISSARLDSNVAWLNRSQTWTAAQTFNENVWFNKNVFIAGNLSYVNVQTLNVNGSLIPIFDNQFNLGNSSNRWANVYAVNVYANNINGGSPITGSGSTGQIAFFTASNTIGGSNNLYWDNTNVRLGIGTNAPSYRLTVSGGDIYGSNNLYIAGNVGIGTTSPSEKLELVSGGNIKLNIFPSDDTTQGLVSIRFDSRDIGGTNHTWRIYTAPIGGGYGVAPNSIEFWEYPPGGGTLRRFVILKNTTASPSVVAIDGAGNVGIGTTGPGRKLDVAGTIRTSGYDDTWTTAGWARGLEMYNAYAIVWRNTSAGYARGIGSTGQGSLYFIRSLQNDNSQPAIYDMIIDTSGNVGIGATTPRSRFEVQDQSGISFFNVFQTTGSALGYGTIGIGFNLVRKPDGTWEARGDGANNAGAAIYGGITTGRSLNFVTVESTGPSTQTFTDSDINTKVRMVITGSGNVGIGTTTPGVKLQVNDNGNTTIRIQPNSGANNRTSMIDFWGTFYNYPSDTGTRRVASIQAGFSTGTWGTEFLSFHVGNNGAANDVASLPIERMRIDGYGRVGIGTTTPSEKLEVSGNIKLSGYINVDGSYIRKAGNSIVISDV